MSSGVTLLLLLLSNSILESDFWSSEKTEDCGLYLDANSIFSISKMVSLLGAYVNGSTAMVFAVIVMGLRVLKTNFTISFLGCFVELRGVEASPIRASVILKKMFVF